MSNPADRTLRLAYNRGPWLTNLLFTLPFLLLYWLNLYHHQSWFDEVNAWGIAAASPNLRTLFHLVHYEGHPWLWYFLLYFPSRLTHNPDQMKWVVAVFGSAIFLVIGLLSPFTRLQKVLLFLSYFVAFEYTVTLRMYGIMFLLALVYAWHRSTRPKAIVTNLALLAVMTNVDMTAVVLSGGLLVEYLYTLLLTPGVEATARRQRLRPVLAGLFLYGLLLALSVASLLPAKDISWQTSGRIGALALNPRQIAIAFGDVVSGPWWPISPDFPHRFWETDAHHQHLLFFLMPLVLFCYWKSLHRQRNLLLLVGTTILFAYLWADVVYLGHVRHWGICFISFVVALWIHSTMPGDREQSVRAASWSPWAYGLIVLNVAAGIVATASSWVRPLSESSEAAAWVRLNEPPNVLITGFPDTNFISVAQHLQRPVFLLECECMDTYKLFSHAHDYFLEPELGARLDRGLTVLQRRQILLFTYHALGQDVAEDFQMHHLKAVPVAQFDRADFKMENYYLYEVSRQ